MVYRNELMELIQYEPQTEQVHATPLLCSPPWINKYYVMDLAPERSFIEWAVQHGRTVFAISYRNPSADMSGTTMDDYLVHGPKTALDVIEEITGADTIDIVGLCLGGALTAITAAYLTQAGDSRIGTLTLLNTMLDYAEPGALGTFTDLATVEKLEKKMAKEGTLPGASMAGTFDILRANDLIFNYVVSNWLMGQKPPAFDILAWNADSTRMPAAMHAFYLRNFYVQNKLAAGELEIAGTTIDLSTIKAPTYVVSAINDHIVPWEAAYKTVGLVSGPVRFVLGNGGHIAGIVSPPGPKAWHLVTETENALPPTGEAWRGVAERRSGTWWEDWARWSSDELRPAAEAAAHGQPQAPGARRGPGPVRARLTPSVSAAPRRASTAISSVTEVRRGGGQAMAPWASWMSGGAGGHPRVRELVGPVSAAGAPPASSRDRLREAMDSGASTGCRSLARSRTVTSMAAITSPPGPNTGIATPQRGRLQLAPGDRDPGQPGHRQRAPEAVRRGHRVRGVRAAARA